MSIIRYCIALLGLCVSCAASAAMVHRSVTWSDAGTTFHGVLVYDDAAAGKRPGLLMVPNWYGVNDAAVKKAEGIAGRDYVILVADLYGETLRPRNDDEAAAAVKPFYADRALMRRRVNLVLAQLKEQVRDAPIDPARIAAIGFCFGGSAVLDLARSGADVAAVVAFHGALDTDDPALARRIKARVLAINGANDSWTMPAAGKFMDEMRASPADWQFVVLGHAVHCFTEVDQHKPGCMYDARAAARSDRLMRDWLRGAFDGTP
ncbi:MAG: dienelactone hydrolase family protein [Fulvimonas sp.]|nr:dienelactone hydrolase family protein [Fulvimonas sp.]